MKKTMSCQSTPAILTKGDLRADFHNPPTALRAMPFWHINGKLTTEEIKAQLEASRDKSGFGGVAVLPISSPCTQPPFLGEEYFARYGDILNTARGLGMQVILYDDIDFPSGTAGYAFAKVHPNDTQKRLDKSEEEISGPANYEKPLPAGVLMGAVAMNTQTQQQINLTASAAGGKLTWKAPEGRWKIMIFTCVDVSDRLVDYLCPESVDKFIGMTYEEYYKRFKEYFGATIRRNFFDDVGFYARTQPWTPAFNEKFRKKRGFDPVPYYPALWYDIGPDTVPARIALFDFRAELLAEGYPARVGAWCRAHGIISSGHPPGNYDPCPVDMNCDIFKYYRHVDSPLMDAIGCHGHGRPGFKLVSSAADVYDRTIVSAEEYGAFNEDTFDASILYRTGMELFVRGVNFVVPHGMWYDPRHVNIPPLISHFSAKLLPTLPDYNRWIARSCLLLQGGRHVVDVAMLYPIASLEAYYNFNLPDDKRWGQYVPPESDYQAVSDVLTCHVRRDFTFVHPETLETQCVVDDAKLRLENIVNRQDYQVFIIPGGKVISWTSLQKIKAFYDRGGKVVATTQLPDKSAEFGHDADVQKTIKAMFGMEPAAGAPPLPCHVRIEISGSTIKTYVRNMLVDTITDDTFKQGRVGFHEACFESATFSNLVVTSPAGKILFQDDFRHGLDQWLNTNNATTCDGCLRVTGDNQYMRSADGACWTDYALDVDLDPNSATAGLVFRAVDDNNYYMWQFVPKANLLLPHKKVNGDWQVIKNVNVTIASANRRGGKAYFAPHPTAETLQAIFNDALPVGDVRFEDNPYITSGNGFLSYLHKVKDGRDFYLFANSSDDRVDTRVRLRGRITPEIWDPHTGDITAAEYEHVIEAKHDVTRVHLLLEPVKSLFIVGAKPETD